MYEFVLRKGIRFHSGDVVSADDVKFSFERYRGAAQKTLRERVTAVETPDASRVRIRLKQPWPDFMTFYSTAKRCTASSSSCTRGSSRRRSGSTRD